MAEFPTPGATGSQVGTDADRYPELVDVFSKILESPDLPDGPVERVEVSCLAGGDATYRIYAPRAEEPATGYFPSVVSPAQ